MSRWLSLIVAAAVVARIAFLVLFGHTLSLQTSGYDAYAVNLIEGQGYTRFEDRSGDSDLPPLYPFFLAGIYKLFGRDPIPVAIVQAGLDVLVMLLLYGIGRRVGGETVGLLAAGFYGFYPYLLFQNLTLNDTGIFILLLVAGIWLAYRAADSHDWRYVAAIGGVFGLGALTKTLILLMLPMLVIIWWHKFGWRQAIRWSLISGLVMVAVLTPWTIRNIGLHETFVLVSTNGGSNLHQGNNACVADYLARGWDAQWVDCLEKTPDTLSEVEADRWHRKQAIDYLWDHPNEWPHLFGTKFWVLWSPAIMPYDVPAGAKLEDDAVLQYNTRTFQAARIIHLVYFTPLLALGIIGLVMAWHDKRPVALLVVPILTVTIAYLIFHPSTRYRAPADPFVFILAAYAVSRLLDRIAPRLPGAQKL